MDWLSSDLIIQILTLVLGLAFGLFITKPGYKKFKAILKSLSGALEDDNLSQEELRALYDLIKPKADPDA